MKQDLLPIKALDTHIAVLGKTGSGKTYAAKGLVETILRRGETPVAVIDPTGAWWGLRFASDGKGPGFKVLILGGEHGDMPLPTKGGEAVARLIVEQGVSVICDTSGMTVGDRSQWFTDFASALFRLNRDPLHLVIDEAHHFAPQGKVPDPLTGKMLHAANTLMSGGRSRGIRGVLITQRPAKLHKDSLTCADALIAMRVLAPQDRDAVKAWIDGCGDPAQGKEVLGTLANLEKGEGWVWWPDGRLLERRRAPQIQTFDSSATPTGGRAVKAPSHGAAIDLESVRAALAEAAAEAEANDPKRLRAEVARLKAELKKAQGAGHHASAKSPPSAEAIEAYRAEGRRAAASGLRPLVKAVEERASALERLAKALASEAESARAMVGSLGVLMEGAAVKKQAQNIPNCTPAPSVKHLIATPVPGRAFPLMRPVAVGDSKLSKAERLILGALSQFPEGAGKSKVALLTGYSPSGGGFSNALSSLRTSGYIEGRGDQLTITDAGRDAVGPVDPLPTGPEALAHWLASPTLGKAERLILAALSRRGGRGTKEEIAGECGYEPSGGGFGNALSRLRTLELITGRGDLELSEVFA